MRYFNNMMMKKQEHRKRQERKRAKTSSGPIQRSEKTKKIHGNEWKKDASKKRKEDVF